MGLAFVGLPTLALLCWLLPSLLASCGLPGTWPAAVARACVVCAMAKLAANAARLLAVSRRCLAAIEHLPAPELPAFGLLSILADRKDVHRVATELVAQGGPVFRLRAAKLQHMARPLLCAACSSLLAQRQAC